MLLKIRPEIELDWCIRGNQVDRANRQRSNIRIPWITPAEQIKASRSNLCITLSWEFQLPLILSLRQCVVANTDADPRGSQFAFPQLCAHFL